MLFSRFALGLVCAATLSATSYNCASLSIPGASSFTITGINNSGVVAGTYLTGSVHHGFEMTLSGSGLQTFDYPGASQTNLYTINKNGVALGVANLGVSGQTPTWFTVNSAGTFTPVTVPSSYILDGVYGINDNGAISAIVAPASTPQQAVFAILNPDGTVTTLNAIGQQAGNQPGSINNSLQMLESDHSFGDSTLVNASGASTQIVAGNFVSVYAFGLNNSGIVAGYTAPSLSAGEGPFHGFTWDSSSKTFSELMCPGMSNSPTWAAINDNGVAAGGIFYATPLPGQPAANLSTTSLTFPPTPVGQTSAPQSVTITNTGTQRLDISSIFASTTVFNVAGCLDATTHTASLNPGAACTLFVTATPTSQSTTTGTITINDSAPGSPQTITASVTGTAPPPACQITSVNPGPPAQVNFSFQDTNSGLKSIAVTKSTNANTSVPTFVSGTVQPQIVTATQINTGMASAVNFQATNVAGGTVSCGAAFGEPSNWMGIGGYFTSKIGAANNSDGSLQIFVRGGDNALWTNQQAVSGGGWAGWTSLGGSFLGDPVVAVNSSGAVQAFVRGSDGSVWTIAETAPGVFGNWQGLGAFIISNPAVAANSDGTLELFAAGGDSAIWTTSQSSGGVWSPWTSLGGAVINDPAVAADVDGLLHVFVLGGDNALWTVSQGTPGGNWSGWSSLGGSSVGDPAIAMAGNGSLEIFIRALNNTSVINYTFQANGGFWPMLQLNISTEGITGDPAAAVNSSGTVDLLWRASDTTLWTATQQGSVPQQATWTRFQNLGGSLANGVTAILNSSGLVQALVQGTDHTLWFITQAAPGFWN